MMAAPIQYENDNVSEYSDDDNVTVIDQSVNDSPEDGNSLTSSVCESRLSSETALSEFSNSPSTISSNEATYIPAAPVNSPDNGSMIDGNICAALDTTSLTERLHAMPGSFISPPPSDSSEKTQKGKREALINESLPLFQQLFKSPSSSTTTAMSIRSKSEKRESKKLTRLPSAAETTLPSRSSSKFVHVSHTVGEKIQEEGYGDHATAVSRDGTYEHSIWAEIAEEDVTHALARLARLARDEQEKDGAVRPAKDYYSARLAKLIRSAELYFDATYLRES